MLSLKDSILTQHAKGMSLHSGYFDTPPYIITAKFSFCAPSAQKSASHRETRLIIIFEIFNGKTDDDENA